MTMTLEWLREFCAAARFSNITKAAEYSYISQSSLSRHIAELEKELNVKLVDRDNRSFELTPAGKYFYTEIQTILSMLESTRIRTQQIGSGKTGQLRIASFCPYIPYMYNKILSFRQKHPEIQLTMNYVANVIPTALLPGSADLGIVFSFEIPDTDDLDFKVIGQDDLCLIVPTDSPLAASHSTVLSAIRDQNIILLSNLRYPFMSEIHSQLTAELTGNMITEVENLETMVLHVRFGDGIAILPRILAQERAGGCVILSIMDIEKNPTLCMCWKKDNQNPILAHFLNNYELY